ncbi:MAG: M14 family zinc carboxypeptidase [Acidobacteriota bacterium]|nr:M14 family zinc carboxypeptidase [Acidobacteriota bacterium]MDH3522756.1 M14 family zinc carboxypeptidase [Acidobacteriota bacterium]
MQCRWQRAVPVLFVLAAILAPSTPAPAAGEVIAPADFLGYPVGADRKLARYDKVLEYLRLVAAASDRVTIESIGRSTLDHEMVAVVLTSAGNQTRLDEYRDIARRLAAADRLTAEEVSALAARGKAIVLVTCSIHSTEVGSTQMAMELVHEFATTEDPAKLAWMDEVILLLVPSINPDGQFLVIDWYESQLGTAYEGGPMPWLYHHYVGHDNNRDFYMLTQRESRVVNDLLYRTWFPQVFIDEHQMGSTGPRMFVPPQTDPLDPEIHPLIFRQADLIGTNMSYRLEEAGKTGVGHDMIFDSYWPGGTRNTAWWKNVTGLLTEVASARIATPVYVDPGELRGGAKGFPEYGRRANFPSVWPGGWWRLRDIVDYERIATWAAVETSAHYRAEILENIARLARAATQSGAAGSPRAWIVAPEQHDPVAAGRLVELLLRHGVRVYAAAESLRVGRTSYPAGTHVIPAAQPYHLFLRTMLRPQRYPEVVPYVDGPVIPPYDVTAWSLPILMGVEVDEIDGEIAGELAEIQEPRWPPPPAREPAPGGHLLPHGADTVFTAINRRLAAGEEVYWLAAPAAGAPGDVWLPAAAEDDALQALLAELHLPATALAAAPAGAAYRVRPPRVGLYKPWVASMDEGWTRFLLESYEFGYVNLANADFEEGRFADRVDVVVLPDVERPILENGEPAEPEERRFWAELPPDYRGGIGTEGGEELSKWVEGGGTLVALDSATDYAIELFGLPVVNVLAGVSRQDFAAPGTLLRLQVDTAHPLGYGLRAEEAGYFAGSPAFRTGLPHGNMDRRVVARYPEHRDDVRVAGYIKGAELLARRAAVVELAYGEGTVILIGFRAQHRAQPVRTFKLLFNALYRGLLEEVELPR